MFNEKVLEYGGILAAGYGLYQTNRLHRTEQEKARIRHLEAINLAKKQHENDIKVTKQTYLLELFNSLEQHFQQLNADLIASSRESERDMFDQRNQSFQTVIVASSVMFSALSTLIVDGVLPDGTSYFFEVTYSLTTALSFSFLFLSMVLSIELVIRTSSFMYNRGKSHTRNLERAIRDTKNMMKELRGDPTGSFYISSSDNMNGEGGIGGTISMDNINNINSSIRTEDNLYKSNNIKNSSKPYKQQIEKSNSLNSLITDTNPNTTMRRIIANMTPQQIDEEFEKHEEQIRKYLKNREKLNDYTKSKAFRDFWIETCSTWWISAVLLFYAGSFNFLLGLMIFMWTKFVYYYSNRIGAIIAVALLGFVSVFGILMVLVMRHTDQHVKRREYAAYSLKKDESSNQYSLEGGRLNTNCSFDENLSNLGDNINPPSINNVIRTTNGSTAGDGLRSERERRLPIINEESIIATTTPSRNYLDNYQNITPPTTDSMKHPSQLSIVIQDSNYYKDDANSFKTLSDMKSMQEIESTTTPLSYHHHSANKKQGDIERGGSAIGSDNSIDSSIIRDMYKQGQKKNLKIDTSSHNPINSDKIKSNTPKKSFIKRIGKNIRRLTTSSTASLKGTSSVNVVASGTKQLTPLQQTPVNEKKTHRPFFSDDAPTAFSKKNNKPKTPLKTEQQQLKQDQQIEGSRIHHNDTSRHQLSSLSDSFIITKEDETELYDGTNGITF